MKMPPQPPTDRTLRAENAELRTRVEEAEEMLRAIRAGEMDALVVEGDAGPRLFTLQGLDAEQNRFRGEMLAQVSDAVIAVDPEERVTFLNAAAERQYGVRAGEVLGCPLTEMFTPHWPSPESEAGMRTALSEHRAWRGELVHRRRDGSELHVESSIAILHDPDGAGIGYIASSRNITERYQAEAARRLTNERLTLAVKCSQVALFQQDLELRYTWLQNAVPGFDDSHAIGKRDADLMERAADAALTEALKREVIRSGVGQRQEMLVQIAGVARHYDLLVEPERDAAGRISGVTCAAIDVTERKRAEEARHEMERNYRALTAASSEIVYRMSADWSTMLPLDGRQLVPSSDQPLADWTWLDQNLPRGEHSRVRQAISEAIARKTLFELEHQVRRPDGSIGWTFSRAAPILDENGEVIAWFGAASDITERRQAEENLRESESRFKVALKNSGILVYTADAELRYSWIHNPHPAFDPADVLGRRDDELLSPEQAAPFIAIKREVLNGGVGRRAEVAIEINGERVVYDLTVEPLRDATGGVVGVTAAATDITERTRVEETLRRSEARLSGILRQSPAGIVQTDAAGCMTLVNPRWCEMLGYPEAELLGRNILEITHHSFVAATAAAFGRLAGGGPDFQIEQEYCRKDDSILRAQSNVAAMRSPAGEFLGIITVVLDISERLHAEAELRRLAADLTQADRRKDEFLATLAHELRNPLAAVRSAVQVIRIRGSAAQPGLEGVHDMIDRQSGHMVRLIDDLMDVSRVTSGKVALKRQTVDLATVIREAAVTACTAYADRHHDVKVKLPERALQVDGDPLRLTQIVTNLLNNSCRYTDDGGHIEVSLSRDGEGGERAILRVRDNGIGISASMLPRVFETFTQADTSLDRATARAGGLGIGLALVKSLVEQHGGSVEACSEGLGKGSEFVVRLPALPAEEPDTEHPLAIMPAARDELRDDASEHMQNPAAPSVRAPQSPRVLVVEDNVDLAHCLALFLKFNGYDTHTARDGQEAIEQAVLLEPDLVLLDIGLPKLNGYEACRAIRERLRRHPPVMVALSGWGQDSDRQKSREAGFDGHLVKPVDNAMLQKVLPELLAQRPSSTEPLADDSALR